MRFGRGVFNGLSGSALLLLGLIIPAQAQQPTAAQASAIRGSCRSDFMANCSDVRPGGRDALECLERNVGKLSPSCKAAVTAVMPAPAEPAATAPAAAPPAAAAAAPTTSPPGAVAPPPSAAPATPTATAPSESLPARRPAPAAAVPRPPVRHTITAPVAREPAPAHQPSAAEIAAIRQSCRSDFMTHCQGVTPGGKDALGCLQRNAAGLSPGCKAAVAVTMSPAGVAERPPAAAAMPAAPGPTVAPLRVRRFILPQRRLVIVGICHADVQRLCAGVPPGGGRILECLGASAANLTPECYAAVARVSER